MISLLDRINNIEENLSIINIKFNSAFTSGIELKENDELYAVRKEIFGRIRNIRNRILNIKEELNSLTKIVNSAKRD